MESGRGVTIESQKKGSIHPERLNNWANVGPLESYAGAHVEDDVTVSLKNPIVQGDALEIETEPVQIDGREMALVTFVKQSQMGKSPEEGKVSAPQEWTVKHYGTSNFNGPTEVFQVPAVRHFPGKAWAPFSLRHIENSALNAQGWYVYGDRDSQGRFVIRALEPRGLMALTPRDLVNSKKGFEDFIDKGAWSFSKRNKGGHKSVLIEPNVNVQMSNAQSLIRSEWKQNRKYLTLHLWGGIEGQDGDKDVFGVWTGHFAFGFAEVVPNPFVPGELKFDIEYKQIYGRNPEGVIPGSQKWHHYMGSLMIGWAFTRPVGDTILRLPALYEDYKFGDINISPTKALNQEFETMMARYRTGNGDGISDVNQATSCSQDSSQALYIALKKFDEIVESQKFKSLRQQLPDTVRDTRFEHLSSLAKGVERYLNPLGIERNDWKASVNNIVYERKNTPLYNTIDAITSINSVLPRSLNDKLTRLVIENKDAGAWMLRTDQIGGSYENIWPISPNTLMIKNDQ
jgi:predicted Abi (CAAX) family protease